ncbi:MAG: efflux RND transporter permease subunit, partial [Ignavibacteriae bacterium]|nr:efflux RND transporter permease subunit [Ignavibacteriota bacterium]
MNKMIEFVLKNRLLVLIFGCIIMVAGYLSYKELPVDAFPDVSPSLVQVFTVTEGLAPEEVEKYVTYPIEVTMNGLPNLKTIRSVSNFGLSVVNIYFEDDTDIYFARQLVNERLNEAKENIPEGFGDPQMGPISTGMGLVLFYYLDDTTGKYSLEELRSMQDWIVKYQLQTVQGVTEVLGIGGYEKQFQVVVNPRSLIRYGVTINEIVEKIKANNLNVGAQFLEKDAEEFVVRSVGLTKTLEDLNDIVIKTEDGTPIYLSQLAKVKIGGAVRRGVQTFNGIKEVVSGMVVKLYGTNSSTVIGQVEQKLEKINKILPKGVSIVPYYEQKTLVETAVKTVTDALWQGILLVIVILVIFMGSIRPSIVVALSVPFSIFFAFIGMKYFGLSINLMSFGGLAIAIGMMVDASIVLVENIDRIKRNNESENNLLKIISLASKEVIQPILFSILIIITVFIPLFTLQGVEGKTFSPLAYTISIAMLGSLIFAIILAPVLSSFIIKNNLKTNHKELWIVKKIQNAYKPILELLIRKRIISVITAVIILVTGVLIFPKLGSEFTPTLQEGTLVLRISMAPSISLTESTKLTMIAERRLMKIQEVNKVVSRIGRGEIGAHTDPINNAELYIIFKPKDKWRKEMTQSELEEIIRDEFGDLPGALANFTQPIQMTVDELLEGVRAELAIKLYGEDLEILKTKAEEIAVQIRNVKGASDIQVDQITGTPQLKIVIDRHKIARYGINVADVQQVIRTAVGGETSGQIFEGIKRFDILVRFDEKFRNNVNTIGEILIQAPNGVNVPLSQLAELEEVIGPRQITRENNQRFITVQANVMNRDIGSFVEEGEKIIDENIVLPAGYYVNWGGQFKLQQEANARFAFVIPITLLIIFILLFFNFGSLKNSMLILLDIPLALVGGVFGLWFTGLNLSVP